MATTERDQKTPAKGPIAWAAANPVAANLLMVLFIVGGLLFAQGVQQEVFPDVQLDTVTISVAYPGAGPEEVEQGIVLAVEEAVRGIEGVKEVRAVAREGQAVVSVELFTDADAFQALDDIKSEVDRITAFPEDAEEPVISLARSRRQVLSLLIHGDYARPQLKAVAETIRQDLLQLPNITLVELDGVPPPEISIEVPQEQLRRYDLTLQGIAQRVAAASIDLPAGDVEAPTGDVLLRVTERRERGDAFGDIRIIDSPQGAAVTLDQIAEIEDGFRDTERRAWYDGQPAVRLRVFRVGDQTPIAVSDSVHQYLQKQRQNWPQALGLSVVDDRSKDYQSRIGMLVDNGQLGVLLVLVILGLVLHPRLAFWVTLGIPISFLGAFLFMPALGVSINMISLFAFLLVLGIVVDDAIVLGEATFHQRRQGLAPYPAAVAGTREVLKPVTFAVLTTILAFVPLLFVPGVTGKFFINIPLIVIPILLISLVESLYILPAHLTHVREGAEQRDSRWFPAFTRTQRRFSRWLEDQVEHRFAPALTQLLHWRYLTLSVAVAVLLITTAFVASGRIPFHFLPKIEGDRVTASVQFPFGAPAAQTEQAIQRLVAAAREAGAELASEQGNDQSDQNGGKPSLVHGVYAEQGIAARAGVGPTVQDVGGHLGLVQVFLVPAAEREIGAATFTRRWREKVGEILGVERLAFTYNTGPSAGQPVAVELAHDNRDTLRAAAEDLAARLGEYEGVQDIDDGFQRGKPQLDITLKPGADALGISERDLALQLRAAFYGVEAKRQQRDRDELRIYVRRPEAERDTTFHIDNFLVQTRGGGEIPLDQAAAVEWGDSFTTIERENGRRTVEVTADVDPAVTSGGKITDAVLANVMPALQRDYPGLDYELAGEQQDQRESMQALARGMAFALLAMYGLMAVAFSSYAQPLLVMLAIPFGLVGATLGHVLLGFDLSMISVFGLVALAGVVVNDSLVLVAAVNQVRRRGESAMDAVIAGAMRRFRPVLLTSLTTFFGLAPMIFETDLQARFLVPMAISLGFGVLFVTLIALVIVPATYLVGEDIKRVTVRWLKG